MANNKGTVQFSCPLL